jgi:hypothetical protein
MAPTTKHAAGPQATTTASARVGPYMLTLCRLEAPISIRPPQSPQLARFKFFMGRSRHADGNQRLYLHMGYFPTLEDAEKCAQVVRARYPQAIATRTPPALLRQASPDTLANSPVPAQPPVLHGIAPADAGALTDTQVLQILETRRVHPGELGKHLPERPEISLLRPDDTNTRRALKEAVVQGVPVSFVVQLCCSHEPIKLGSVASLDIFRAYTLYLAEGTHQGRPWYALRLGFFSDAVSAKQVAHYAHARFASVAVVPINEGERTRARKKPVAITLLADTAERSIDDVLAADQANSSAEAAKYPSADQLFSTSSQPGSARNRATANPTEKNKDTLERTLELLASSEIWGNSGSDSLSDTGVRHLKVQVQKRTSSSS